ncbi:MAG: hypothetical protein QXI37_02815, partial [Thermoprotei archaeon]
MAADGIRHSELRAVRVVVDSSGLIHALERRIDFEEMIGHVLGQPFTLAVTEAVKQELARMASQPFGKLRLRARLASKMCSRYTVAESTSQNADESILEACTS